MDAAELGGRDVQWQLNRFMLICLTGAERTVELRHGGPAKDLGVDRIGRKTNLTLDNLHISRDQLHFKLGVDVSGKAMLLMFNKGKNSTRLLANKSRKRPARVGTDMSARIIPGDIIEVLYDHQGRYAFKVVECSAGAGPIVRRTPLVPSYNSFQAFKLPPDRWLVEEVGQAGGPAPRPASDPLRDLARQVYSREVFTVAVDREITRLVQARASPSLHGFVRHIVATLGQCMIDGPSNQATSVLAAVRAASDFQWGTCQEAPSSFLSRTQAFHLALAVVRVAHGTASGFADEAWPYPRPSRLDFSDIVVEEEGGSAGPGATRAGDVSVHPSEDSGKQGAEAGTNLAASTGPLQTPSPKWGRPPAELPARVRAARRSSRLLIGLEDVCESEGGGAGEEGGVAHLAARIRQEGGQHHDALEEWDEADEIEDARAAEALRIEGEDGEEGEGAAAPGPSSSLPRLHLGSASRSSDTGHGASHLPPSTGVDAVGDGGGYGSVVMEGTEEEGGVGRVSPRTPFVALSLSMLPHAALLEILSFLTLPEAVCCTGVCKEWGSEVARPSALHTLDFGSVFPGPTPPDPVLIDTISRKVRARCYDFSNCQWLSAGALLHILGIPVGVRAVTRTPAVTECHPKMAEEARKAKAEAMASDMRRAVEGGTAQLHPPYPAAPCLPGTHTYIRHFLGEWSEAHVRSGAALDASRAAQAGGWDAGHGGGGGLSRPESAATLPSLQACEPSPAAWPGGAGIHATPACSSSMLLDESMDTSSDSKAGAVGPERGVAAAAAATSSLSAMRPWWPTLAEGVAAASSSRPSWLPVEDMCLALVGAEVLRQRLRIQQLDSQRTSLPIGSVTTLYTVNSDVSAPAYAEMALAMQALRHRHRELKAAAGGGAGGGGGSAHSAAPARAAVLSPVVQHGAGIAQLLRGGPSRFRAEDARDDGRVGEEQEEEDEVIDLSCPPEDSPPPLPTPPLLLSGGAIMNATAMVAASVVFAPLAQMRAQVATAFTNAARLTKNGWGAPSRSRFSLPPLPPWDVSIHCDDAITLPVLLESQQNVHAVAVAYTVAASELFDFGVYLAEARAKAESRRGVYLAEARAKTESRRVAGGDAAALPPRSSGGDGDGDALMESACPLDTSRHPSTALAHQLVSLEIPAPAHAPAPPLGACCPPPVHCLTREQTAGLGPLLLRAEDNLLGVPVPLHYTSPVTGLDLTCCTRLSVSNVALLLSYMPHLTTLRLTGCHQMSHLVLAPALAHVPKLKVLDLEYVGSVNDSVLASLGRHCPLLVHLNLGGCLGVSDAGLGPTGLMTTPGCTRLRSLNLRGCRLLTDVGLSSVATGCPAMRQLCLSGCPMLTAQGLAHTLISLRKLARFQAELWVDSSTAKLADSRGLEAPEVPIESGGRKQYRDIRSAAGAARYLHHILKPDDPLKAWLQVVYPAEEGSSGEGRSLLPPPRRGGDTSASTSGARGDGRGGVGGGGTAAFPFSSVQHSLLGLHDSDVDMEGGEGKGRGAPVSTTSPSYVAAVGLPGDPCPLPPWRQSVREGDSLPGWDYVGPAWVAQGGGGAAGPGRDVPAPPPVPLPLNLPAAHPPPQAGQTGGLTLED